MTASNLMKALMAGATAVALVGTAMAQGSPPNPAIKNPAIGAGQQSSQQTPMGTTGTPGGNPAPMGTTAGSTSGTTMSSTPSTSSAPATSMGATSSSSDMNMASAGSRPTKRARRADRN